MKIGRKYTDAFGAILSDNLYCALVNLRCRIRGRSFRLSKSKSHSYYDGVDTDGSIVIVRRNRFKRYDRGVFRWVNILANSYCLDHVAFKKNDVVIDCGANIGELGIWTKPFGVKYIPFEPEEAEADCSDLNNFDAKQHTQRYALWFEKTTLEFYSKPDSADSSAIEFNDYSEVKRIEAVTLDDFVKEQKIKKIKLLKLEAEGAEPEVLRGALKILNRIEYITIDCGFERGITQDSTFHEVNEILVENGFSIVTGNLKRPSFLYSKSA